MAAVASSLLLGPALSATLPTGVTNAPPTIIGRAESIGSDSTLNVMEGGVVGDSFMAGVREPFDGPPATNVVVNISGGTVGRVFEALAGSTINISGGEVGSQLQSFAGSTVNLSGGSVGGGAFVLGTLNISGGSIGRSTTVSGGAVNISGGDIGVEFVIFSGVTNVSGGSVFKDFFALNGGELNIFGTEFFLDDTPLTLAPGVPTIITARNQTLSGVLADGELFEFELSTELQNPDGTVVENATLTLTIVPEPAGLPLILLGATSQLVRRRRKHA